MYCHTISPGSLISWYKGAAPPPFFPLSLHFTSPPLPFISHPCVLYYVLLACDHIFLVIPIPFSFLFHKEVVVHGGNVANSICKETSPYFMWDNAELFFDTFSERRLASLRWFSCFVFVDKSKTVESTDMTVWIVCISQVFADSSQFCKRKF